MTLFVLVLPILILVWGARNGKAVEACLAVALSSIAGIIWLALKNSAGWSWWILAIACIALKFSSIAILFVIWQDTRQKKN